MIQSGWAKNQILASSLNAPCETLSSIDHLREDKVAFKHTSLFGGDRLMCTSKRLYQKDHCTLWNTFVVSSSSVSQCSQQWEVASLLQVTVHLEAVVARVGYRHVAIRGEGQALGPVKRVRGCVNVGQEGPGAVEHLVQWRESPSDQVQNPSLGNQHDVIFLS